MVPRHRFFACGATALLVALTLLASPAVTAPAASVTAPSRASASAMTPIETSTLARSPEASPPVSSGLAAYSAPQALPIAPQPRLQASSPLVTTGWDALHYGTDSGIANGWVPPDVQVAAGPNHVVEMVNLLMGVYTKGGVQVRVTALADLFGSGSDFISDPKVQYDPASGRWFASVTDVTADQVLLAVSSTSDPTGPWRLSPVPATPATGECLDQPILGVGTRTVIVSVNVFTQTKPNTCAAPYLGAQYWVVNKTDLVAGATPRIFPSLIDANEGSIHPVQIQGSSDAHYMVSTYWPGAATTSDTLHLFTVTGTPPGLVTVTVTSLSMPTAALPPPAPQFGSGHTIDTADIRISDAAWQNGRLWLGFDEACLADPARACVRLAEIDTGTRTLVQDFDVDVAGKSVFYPAFRMDGQGNLAVVLGYSSSSDYPGILATGRVFGDAPNTYQAPLVVLAGTGPESPSGCSGTCRYGDYFGAGLDPSDPTAIWLAGQFGTASGWSTRVFAATVKAEIAVVGLIQGGGSGYQLPALAYVINGTPRTSTLDTTASVLADPGSAWSVTSTLVGSTSEERWQAGPPQGTPSTEGTADASFNATFVYYHQYAVTFGATVQGTPASPPVIAANRFGLQEWVAADTPTWIDAGSPYAYANPLNGSTSSERWSSADAIAGTLTGPANLSVAYHHQFLVRFDFTVLGTLPYLGPAPAVRVVSFGSAGSLPLPATAWADAGGAYAFPAALPGSNDTVRWGAQGAATGTVVDASALAVVYYAQYAVVVRPNPAAAAGLLTGGGWYEPGATAAVSASSNASWAFQGWTGGYAGMGPSLQLAVNGPIVLGATFWPGLTIVAGDGGSVAYAYGSTTGTVAAGSSFTLFVPPGTVVTLTASPGSSASTFSGWSGAASGTSSSAAVTVQGPGTATAAFGANLAILVGLPAVVLVVVALLVAVLMLRRRRRGRPPAVP